MKRFLASIVLLTGPVAPAVADVTAEVIPNGTGGTVDVDEVSGKWEVVFDRSNITGDVELHVYGETTDTIRFIEIDDSGNALSKKTFIFVGGSDPGSRVGAVERIEEVSGSGNTILSELLVLNDLGDGGNDEYCIDVDSILSADIGGDVTDAIFTDTGTMDDFLVGGDFLGSILVEDSTLIRLDVAGAIGSVGTPVTIQADDDIRIIEAAEIHANIAADFNNDHSSRYIHRVAALAGDLTGTLTADYFYPHNTVATDGIHVAGDMDADLTLTDDIKVPIVIDGDLTGTITADALNSGNDGAVTHGTITIGDKLIGDLVISDSTGLDEQVIINTNNNVYTNWTDAWVGDVIVFGTTVDAGDYTNTTLGDGAIGLARFTIHEQACDPAQGADLTAGQAPTTVRLVHYGPVLLYPNVTTISHVKVDRRTYGSNGAWTAVSTHYEVDTGSTGGRTLALKAKSGYAWDAGYEYQFTHYPPVGMLEPVHGYLNCDVVSGNPSLLSYNAADGAYVYSFKIQP